MKKPEPWPVMISLPLGILGVFGMPNCRKNFSNGEPGGNGLSSLVSLESAWRSILTRTEITAGFTLSTMSAKPTGRSGSCWTFLVRFCASTAVPSGLPFGGGKNAATPIPAIAVVKSAIRRADKMRRDGRKLPFITRLQIDWFRRPTEVAAQQDEAVTLTAHCRQH